MEEEQFPGSEPATKHHFITAHLIQVFLIWQFLPVRLSGNVDVASLNTVFVDVSHLHAVCHVLW